MDWYVVIKTINGRRYKYRQKTWREGGRVCCRSEYIGPADGPSERHTPAHPDLDGAATLPLPFPERHVLPEFDPASAKRCLDRIMEKDCRYRFWEHHWVEDEGRVNLVDFDPRVAGMVKALKVALTDDPGGAYFSPRFDLVNIPPQKCFRAMNGQNANAAYHVVLFHEVVHWTAPEKRAGRGRVKEFSTKQGYAREELVAELGAVMLMEHFGMDIGNFERHAHYFQHWLERAGPQTTALNHAKREAVRAVQYLLQNGKIQP